MKYRALSAALVAVVLAGSIAFAGDEAKKMDPKAKAEMMKAEMMKCAMCKNMVTNFDALMPVMTMEVVKMNNGMAMVHHVSDPAKVALYHADHDAMGKAAEECMKFTPEQKKAQLCEWCQEMFGAMEAGATMSVGKTKDGDILLLMSNDPKVQARLTEMHAKCEVMMSQM
jgi:hypothetical protein